MRVLLEFRGRSGVNRLGLPFRGGHRRRGHERPVSVGRAPARRKDPAGVGVMRFAGPRRVMALLALSCAAGLTLASSASAQSHAYALGLNPQYSDTLAVTPTYAPPGAQVTIRGTGWDPALLSSYGSASSGLPIIYEAPRPVSSGLSGTAGCSPNCYGQQVASIAAVSFGCNPCGFMITTTVPSTAPAGPGAFQVGTPAGPVGQEADFTVTQSNVPVIATALASTWQDAWPQAPQ